nr:ribonuclease H-like domain-containing protein [Tanacetum cinerariifolium]
MNEFCKEKGIKREYNVARTPHQNKVAKKRNRTLIEAARTMLADSKLPTTFWAEALILLVMCKIGTRKVEENLHITFLENKPMIAGGGPEWLFDLDALSKSMIYAPVSAVDARIFDDANDDTDEGATTDYNNLETLILVSPIPSTRIYKDHPKEHIIKEMEPKKVTQALDDESWVEAMQEELLQFKLLNV